MGRCFFRSGTKTDTSEKPKGKGHRDDGGFDGDLRRACVQQLYEFLEFPEFDELVNLDLMNLRTLTNLNTNLMTVTILIRGVIEGFKGLESRDHPPSTSNQMEPQPKPTPAWALSFPEPRSSPSKMSPDALHELMTTKAAGADFIVVDVRRTDVDVRQFP
jgi:hypothetical protein